MLLFSRVWRGHDRGAAGQTQMLLLPRWIGLSQAAVGPFHSENMPDEDFAVATAHAWQGDVTRSYYRSSLFPWGLLFMLWTWHVPSDPFARRLRSVPPHAPLSPNLAANRFLTRAQCQVAFPGFEDWLRSPKEYWISMRCGISHEIPVDQGPALVYTIRCSRRTFLADFGGNM